jgi:hypothetical protein
MNTKNNLELIQRLQEIKREQDALNLKYEKLMEDLKNKLASEIIPWGKLK